MDDDDMLNMNLLEFITRFDKYNDKYLPDASKKCAKQV